MLDAAKRLFWHVAAMRLAMPPARQSDVDGALWDRGVARSDRHGHAAMRHSIPTTVQRQVITLSGFDHRRIVTRDMTWPTHPVDGEVWTPSDVFVESSEVTAKERGAEPGGMFWRLQKVYRTGSIIVPETPEESGTSCRLPARPVRGFVAPSLARFLSATLLILLTCALTGCTAISIDPECPEELRVGESGTVLANEKDPGAVPTYLWEVFPAGAGVFDDETAPKATFTAQHEVDIVIRLTASDGLYQMVAQCSTRIRGAVGLAVALDADPASALVGETVALTCTSIGEDEAIALAITQVGAGLVELTRVSDGVSTFTPTQIGDLTFQCVGENADGRHSEPAPVSVSVTLSPSANENDNTSDNGNDNAADNENENINDNENDNGDGGRPPPIRPGN